MGTYLTFDKPVHVEPDPIKRSRFIGDGCPIHSIEDALAFIEAIRQRYPDAGHHCFAWRLAEGDQGFRVSDDGEPGGTGGQPILNHIDGAELRGIVIVVTRYFGGTKLGKGGLIRAYGGTAGDAIKAANIVSVVEKTSVTFTCDYSDQGTVDGVLRAFEIDDPKKNYTDIVEMEVAVPSENEVDLRRALIDATSGRLKMRPD